MITVNDNEYSVRLHVFFTIAQLLCNTQQKCYSKRIAFCVKNLLEGFYCYHKYSI